jgi:hydroxysqualene dehydroxylase
VEARTLEPVVIVGGGLSGLAAAVELSSQRIPVLLLEQKPYLGGRAYSFRDMATGQTVDNGQHALIAGYHRTRALLSRIGTDAQLVIQPRSELHLHHPERGFVDVRFPRLPAPLHLLWGGISSSLFTADDAMPLLRAGWSLLRSGGRRGQTALSQMTILEWLQMTGQTHELRRSFWEPLAISIMNEHLDRASAMMFVNALRTAFLGGWRHSALAIPSVGLSELFASPARKYIRENGGEVRCTTRVNALSLEGGAVRTIQTSDGEQIPCRAVILAVPSGAVEPLLPEALRSGGYLHGITSLPTSPIVSMHIWYGSDFMTHNVLGLVGRRIQWVFKRKGYISAVISAAHGFTGMSNAALAAIAQEDLTGVYGGGIGMPRHYLVIREKKATYSSSPEVEAMRPGTSTPVPNLFLAGDWTATGYPATIEGAVVSGEAAAARCISLQNS